MKRPTAKEAALRAELESLAEKWEVDLGGTGIFTIEILMGYIINSLGGQLQLARDLAIRRMVIGNFAVEHNPDGTLWLHCEWCDDRIRGSSTSLEGLVIQAGEHEHLPDPDNQEH